MEDEEQAGDILLSDVVQPRSAANARQQSAIGLRERYGRTAGVITAAQHAAVRSDEAQRPDGHRVAVVLVFRKVNKTQADIENALACVEAA